MKASAATKLCTECNHRAFPADVASDVCDVCYDSAISWDAFTADPPRLDGGRAGLSEAQSLTAHAQSTSLHPSIHRQLVARRGVFTARWMAKAHQEAHDDFAARQDAIHGERYRGEG